MTYPAGAQRHQGRQTGTSSDATAAEIASVLAEGLSEQQKRILDRLQSATAGLTLKQMEASLSYSPELLQAAIDDLVERQLVCALNTLIPSYLSRYPGIRLYAE